MESSAVNWIILSRNQNQYLMSIAVEKIVRNCEPCFLTSPVREETVRAHDEGLTLHTSALESLYGGQFML